MAGKLFSMLTMGANALHTQQILLNVAGQNVANAATPGYTRQRADVVQEPDVRIGSLIFSLGSSVATIDRLRESLIDDRLRRENNELGELSIKVDFLNQVEDILAEPSQEGIAQALSNFFDSLQELANNPENEGVRTTVTGSGVALADAFNTTYELLTRLRLNMNQFIKNTVDEINRLGAEIGELNQEISALEAGGGTATSNAARDSRDLLLDHLAELVNVQIRRNQNGTVNVYIDGFGLVQDFSFNPIAVRYNSDLDPARDDFYEVIAAGDGNRPLDIRGGRLRGLLDIRDGFTASQVIGDLDELALEIMEQVNRIHSQGQGLVRQGSMTSSFAVSDPDLALDSVGLPFTPVDGTFFLSVYDSEGQFVEQQEITIDADTDTLNDVAGQINSAFSSGSLTATVTADNRLQIDTTATGDTFSFVSDDTQAGDMSDFLLAIGMNSFFEFNQEAGASASIAVSDRLVADSALVAAGRSTGPGDNSNALALAQLRNAPLLGTNGSASVEEFFQSTLLDVGFTTRQSIDRLEIQSGVVAGITNLRDSVMGVSLDEEGVNIIRSQQAYEASARFIAAVSDILEILLTEVG